MPLSLEQLTLRTGKLLDYCRAHDWRGYDPYDALNSALFRLIPFLDTRLPRLVVTQALKRSPFNLRPLLLVPETQNPKGLALFVMALLKLSTLARVDREELLGTLIQRLVALRSPHTSYWCWGYSFPWQTRTHLVPRGAPNLVCTTFVANALLDTYETTGDRRLLGMAVSAGNYVVDELYWTAGDSVAGFSYPAPSSRAHVHNANFLGAALLCRLSSHTAANSFLAPALKVARYSAARQHADGAWDYGEAVTQRWVDNFHTGYNLCALQSIAHYADTSEFHGHLHRGLQYYRRNFFRDDGAPKYFCGGVYPIDIHSVAQSIITLVKLNDLDEDNAPLARAVYGWAMDHLWDERGYFYYQSLPFYTNKVSYMRWSQAWMLLALATLLEHSDAAAVVTDGIAGQGQGSSRSSETAR